MGLINCQSANLSLKQESPLWPSCLETSGKHLHIELIVLPKFYLYDIIVSFPKWQI